jgi:hypothetical protein
MKLLEIINVGFDAINQLLARFLHSSDSGEKKREHNETVQQLFVDFKKTYDSVRREVFYSIPIKFRVPMKVYLNKMYSKVRIGKYFSYNFPIRKWYKIRRCFVATAFQLCFRICH